jgi:hypothetical protein
MRKYAVQVVTVLAGLLGVVLLFQPSTASAGQAPPGGCGYNCGTTTTKVTYPTTTTKPPHETTTTYPHQTTTTKPQETTTTQPHQTTTTKPEMTTTTQPHETTTTQPEQTTTTQPEQTTTTQPMETTTTQPEQTTTTQPAETTTTQPGETTTTEQPNLTILTLAATVNGGTATLADFTLDASGPVSLSGITDSPGVTFAVVPPGTYGLFDTLSPLAQSEGYTNSGWSCVGSASFTPASTTLDQGEDALCVINFTTQFAVTTTTAPGATTTAPSGTTLPGATTTIAPTGTTIAPSGTTLPPGQTTPGGPGTPAVQTITPETAVPALVTPASASGTLPFTGSNTRLGLGSGLLLVMAGGVIVLLTRRFKRS